MQSRISLQKKLKEILGSSNVYYVSPTKVTYPCIIYDRSTYDITHADNTIYKKLVHYTVQFITKDADAEETIGKLLELPYCSFNRQYVSDNLYHCVFDLYY